MKAIPETICCHRCNKTYPLRVSTFLYLQRLADVDGVPHGYYCPICYKVEEEKLRNKRRVEVYKGSDIYCKNGRYSPYWNCPYYFTTIEACRARIDSKTTAVMLWQDGFVH